MKDFTISPPTLEYTRDGYLATVSRAMIEKPCSGGCGKVVKVPLRFAESEVLCRECRKVEVRCSKCGEVFRITPSRVKEVNTCRACGGEVGDGKRGKVTTFSKASSRRLGREVARLKLSVNMNFVTLTFPDAFPFHNTPGEWKKHLKMFELRFRRAFPYASFVWKQEVTDRKSGARFGKLSPHYHLLVVGVSTNVLKRWVPWNWYEIASYGDSDHLKVHQGEKAVEMVRSQKKVRQYAVKRTAGSISSELAKQVQTLNDDESVGRWWGIVGRDMFELLKSAIHTIAGDAFTEKHAIILIRYFRRMAHINRRAFYKLSCYIDGNWVYSNITRLLEPVGRDRYQATGRRYNVPFWKWAYSVGKWEPTLEGV